MAITNIATETLVGINFKNLLNNSSKVKSFLEEQTTSIKTKLTNLENDLVSLQTNNVYLGDPETHRLMSETYFQKRKSLDKLQVDFASTQLYIKELEHEIAYVKDQLSSDQPSYTYFSQLKDRYELLK